MNCPSSSCASDIFNKLAYYHVFSYPLTLNEISKFCKSENITEEINLLIQQGLIFKHDEFYSLSSDISSVKKRIEGNKRSVTYLEKGIKKAKLIAKFPFVKAVLISGSLSKGYMAEDGDVDFFIITQKNRLWIARTSLILYKKIFLLNSRKYFCVNYFVDEENLEIKHKNIFTATEITTLLPVVNNKIYSNFMESNNWIYDYYPSASSSKPNVLTHKRSTFQKITEPLINNKMGEELDKYFMKLTLKKWNSKFSEMNSEDFNIAMETSRRASKHHPSNFQKHVLESHEEIIKKYKSLCKSETQPA
jgi:hypothetical protein